MSFQPPQGPGGPGWGPQGYPQQPGYPQQGYPPQGYGQPIPPQPPKSKASLIAILGIVGACSVCVIAGAVGKNNGPGSPGGSSSTPTSQRQYITQSCSEVAHIFGMQTRMTELQQDEAWRQYDEKWVRWQVRVGSLGETLGQLQLQFKCGTESLLFDGHAMFDDNQRPQLLQLREGDSVTIEGRLTDHGRLMGLTISDATVAR